MGDMPQRRRTIRRLEKTAQTLENIWGEFIKVENEIELLRKSFAALEHLSPSRLVSELRFHIRFLGFAELIAKHSEARSLEEVLRYCLTSYVKQATGKFHDAETSGLLADVVGPLDYNEVAQRMWRLRNYKHLDKRHADLTEIAVSMATDDIFLEHLEQLRLATQNHSRLARLQRVESEGLPSTPSRFHPSLSA